MQNSGSSNIDATNNWWGTTDTGEIDAGIHDAKDDSNLGLVTYQPFLTQPVDITFPPALPANDDFDTATVFASENTVRSGATWYSDGVCATSAGFC